MKYLRNYYTSKLIKFDNYPVLCLSYICQFVIIFVASLSMINQEQHQDFCPVQSAVNIHIQGTAYPNFTDDEFNPKIKKEHIHLYRTVRDLADYVIYDKDAVFILTNLVITPNQTQSVCSEDITVEGALCNPSNNTCIKGQNLLNGKMTGNCIKSASHTEDNSYSCEILAWCPVQNIIFPLKNNSALLEENQNLVLTLRNFAHFPDFQVTRRNIKESANETYLNSCRYDANNTECPNFYLHDVLKWVGDDFKEIAYKGSVIVVLINWDCDLDSEQYENTICFPTYSFHHLHKNYAESGWDFKHAEYYNDFTRTSYTYYGIKFIVKVQGHARKTNWWRVCLVYGHCFGLLYLEKEVFIFIMQWCKPEKIYEESKKEENTESDFPPVNPVRLMNYADEPTQTTKPLHHYTL